MHLRSSALFCTRHTSHSHVPIGFRANSSNLRLADVEPLSAETGGLSDFVAGSKSRAAFAPVPGLGVSQAIHFVDSGLFCTKQVSQSQVPAAFLNRSPNPCTLVKVVVFLTEVLGVCEVIESFKSPVGSSFGMLQDAHLLSDALLSPKHLLQYQIPKACLLNSLRAAGGLEGGDDVLLEGEEVGVVCWKLDEAEKPGLLRISSTLPSFKVFAGLKNPLYSSSALFLLLLFVAQGAGLLGADILLAWEEKDDTFIAGTLNVKPTDDPGDCALDSVAFTMGDENVNSGLLVELVACAAAGGDVVVV